MAAESQDVFIRVSVEDMQGLSSGHHGEKENIEADKDVLRTSMMRLDVAELHGVLHLALGGSS